MGNELKSRVEFGLHKKSLIRCLNGCQIELGGNTCWAFTFHIADTRYKVDDRHEINNFTCYFPVNETNNRDDFPGFAFGELITDWFEEMTIRCTMNNEIQDGDATWILQNQRELKKDFERFRENSNQVGCRYIKLDDLKTWQ